MSKINSIGIVGTGKAAHFFSGLFNSHNIPIQFIAGRNQQSGMSLASKVNSVYYSLEQDLPQCDLILLAVKDDALPEIADIIVDSEAVFAHCAGSVSIDVLRKFKRNAVIYPLQSLSDNTNPAEVPLLIEGNSSEVESLLISTMQTLGMNHRLVNSEKRLHYHLAAVFANNFSNAILTATSEVGKMYQLEFELLKPLISATYRKVLDGADPKAVQTGPAVRGDMKTMDKHLQMLEHRSDLKLLYKAISSFLKSES